MSIPQTRYAKSGDVHIAYQTFGEGPVNVVLMPGFVSHVENCWSEPGLARWYARLGQGCRVALFDKRGTGLSDNVQRLPSMDERMDDLRAVMDAAEFDKAALLGMSEGGSLAALFAAHHPDRCEALVLYGAFARFASWIPTTEALERLLSYMDTEWGSGESLPKFAPNYADDPMLKAYWSRFERLGANPAAAMKLMRMNSQIDISHVLPSIHVPTLVLHRTDDAAVNVNGGRELAASIPNAKLVEFSGADHLWYVGDNSDEILAEIYEFLLGEKPKENIERTLATVLFTDVVGSTALADTMGDRRWREIVAAHDDVINIEMDRFRGRKIKSLGDGVLAVFDGPSRAVSCAIAVAREVKKLGLEVRAGLHTGEVELNGGDVCGLAVNIASRIADRAGSSEVLVSRTVRDLAIGSDVRFRPVGPHELSGYHEPMELYAAG